MTLLNVNAMHHYHEVGPLRPAGLHPQRPISGSRLIMIRYGTATGTVGQADSAYAAAAKKSMSSWLTRSASS